MEVMTKRNNKMMCRVLLASLAAALGMWSSTAIGAAASGNESLGGKLLDDLDPSQFGPRAAIPKSAPTPPNEQQPPSPAPARQNFEKHIVPDLSTGVPGEDVGQRSGGAALEQIERQMGTAQSLLHQAKSPDRASEIQQKVVADLDALIAQLSKQCQGGACQSSGECKSPSQRAQAAGAKPAAKPGGASPARDSTTRIGRNDPKAVDLGDREQLLKDFWGHLPPHTREQMLQSHSDEFLPQYELDIEQYYRRLSEEDGPDSTASR
jgi:hypothetical protein